MSAKITFPAAILIILMIGCKNKPELPDSVNNTGQLSGEINISGAWALEPLMKAWATEFTKQYPDLKIAVMANGTGAGIKDLMDGKTGIAMASRELLPDEEALELWSVPVTKEGVLPIMNASAQGVDKLMQTGLTREKLKAVFTQDKTLTWGDLTGTEDKRVITPVTRSDESGAEVIWARYLGCSLSEFKGVEITGDTGMIKKIRTEQTSIGFCNAHYAYDSELKSQSSGIRVLPVDLNKNGKIDAKENVYNNIESLHRAAYLGIYPSALCRNLLLVTKNKPEDRNIAEFIRWILTDGQELAVKLGYCEI
ncbi:MAG TPA: substrate-binding domain-containing protein, partial [Bacteroidales bacterium]|nr:substrate-binding domain-containing protein [Bacteroidales bacterium]